MAIIELRNPATGSPVSVVDGSGDYRFFIGRGYTPPGKKPEGHVNHGRPIPSYRGENLTPDPVSDDAIRGKGHVDKLRDSIVNGRQSLGQIAGESSSNRSKIAKAVLTYLPEDDNKRFSGEGTVDLNYNLYQLKDTLNARLSRTDAEQKVYEANQELEAHLKFSGNVAKLSSEQLAAIYKRVNKG